MLKRTMILMLVIFVLSGCANSDTATPTATVQANAIPAVFPTLPPSTAVSVPTTAVNEATPTPFTSFTAKPAVDSLKVRVNPGYMFTALRLVNQTDTVTVLGSAPGHEWTFIKTEDGTEGWVFTLLLKSSVDLKQVPVRQPKEVQLIKGRVTDINGNPIPGVAFAAGEGVQDASSSNTASTDANGEFYFFIPSDVSGTWNVSYTGIACDSPVWSDSSCGTYKAGYTGTVEPSTGSVSLPQSTPLNFTWK